MINDIEKLDDYNKNARKIRDEYERKFNELEKERLGLSEDKG